MARFHVKKRRDVPSCYEVRDRRYDDVVVYASDTLYGDMGAEQVCIDMTNALNIDRTIDLILNPEGPES